MHSLSNVSKLGIILCYPIIYMYTDNVVLMELIPYPILCSQDVDSGDRDVERYCS